MWTFNLKLIDNHLHANTYFKLFMERYDLIDTWRIESPDQVMLEKHRKHKAIAHRLPVVFQRY